MRRRDVSLAILLLSLASNAMADDTPTEVQTLIKQLGDREPKTRENAIEELRGLGEAARPALRRASRSDSPAVADAATALLMEKRWFQYTDPREVQIALRMYGHLPPEQRGDALHTLIQAQPVQARTAIVRVLQQDPSDMVAWQALEGIPVDAAWLAEFKNADLKAFPPGLLMFYARICFDTGDTKTAIPLMQRALEREADHPSAAAHQLLWPVNVLADIDVKDHHPDQAADRLRALLARADDQMTSQSDLMNEIFNLQGRFGPLAGIAQDIAAAQKDVDGRAGLMLGMVAERIDAPFARDLLMDAALADRPNENDVDKAVRLFEAGSYLVSAGQFEEAERTLTRVTQIDQTSARGYVANAYFRLSQLYIIRRRWQQAGDSWQRALDRSGPDTTVNVTQADGAIQVLSKEDCQARVGWLYYLDAKDRNDPTGMKKQAAFVMASGGTDSAMFLDVLPTLEITADPAALDAYFDRVYQTQKADLDQSPGVPVKLNDLAWLCGRSNRRLDEAAIYAQGALKLKPDEPAYLDTYAEIRFRQGAIAEAIKLETRAAALDPDEPFMGEQLTRFRKAAATQPNR